MSIIAESNNFDRVLKVYYLGPIRSNNESTCFEEAAADSKCKWKNATIPLHFGRNEVLERADGGFASRWAAVT